MSIKGFSSNKVRGNQEYVTLQQIGSGKVGVDMLPKALYPVQILPFTASDGSDTSITAVGIGAIARIGDVVRMTTGNNEDSEFSVIDIDTDTLILGHKLNVPLIATDEFLLMRHITLTIDKSGALSTTSGPIQFVKDSLFNK